MAEAVQPPMPPALRIVRAGFACLLVLSLAFAILMAAWGDLRDAIFVRVLDDRYAKSFVFVAPEGAHVWLGEQYLGVSALPVIVDSQPDAVIDGVSVQFARVYANESEFHQQAIAVEPGAAIGKILGRIAPARELVHAAQAAVPGPGAFIPLLLRDATGIDAACLCSLEIPQRGSEATLFVFLLRVQAGESRCIQGGKFSIGSTQLYAPPGEFWTRREETEGFPTEGVRGQARTSWRLLPEMLDEAGQREYLQQHGIAEAKWIDLPFKKR